MGEIVERMAMAIMETLREASEKMIVAGEIAVVEHQSQGGNYATTEEPKCSYKVWQAMLNAALEE